MKCRAILHEQIVLHNFTKLIIVFVLYVQIY